VSSDAGQAPRFGNLQVEVSSRCNLRCRTCVAHELHDQWRAQDLSATAFARIEQIAPRCGSIHLQGWGESLLRDDLPELVRRLKAQGCQVTLSSNGTIMNAALARALIDAGLDSMAFSLAGATAATQDPLRGAGTFALAVAAIRLFIAQRTGKKRPPVLVNYLLSPRNMDDLARAVLLCSRLGVDGLKGTHIVHVCTREQRQLIGYQAAGSRGRGFFWSRALAFFLRLPLWLPPMVEELVPICEKNPLNNLFVASDGSVSPCVFLNPPLTGDFPLWREGREHQGARFTLGNVNEQALDEIWQTPAAQAFRQPFQDRVRFYASLLAKIPADSEGARRLERAVAAIEERFAADLLAPPPCRGCPQLQGL